jgi:hypothetical protein
MHKYILTAFLLNEAVSLSIAEPLNMPSAIAPISLLAYTLAQASCRHHSKTRALPDKADPKGKPGFLGF